MNQLSGIIPADYLALLSEGLIKKSLLPRDTKIRKLASRVVSMRVKTAKDIAKAKGHVFPTYLSNKQFKSLLLIYYWQNTMHVRNDSFYQTKEWRSLRGLIMDTYGHQCMACSSTNDVAVDHVKSRLLYPERQLDPYNLQVLCRGCNSSKGIDSTKDYRPASWVAMLNSSRAIQYFVKEAGVSPLRKATGVASRNGLPAHLSITQEFHSPEIKSGNELLEILEPVMEKIIGELKSLKADGRFWCFGVRTCSGWVHQKWFAMRSKKSLAKFLNRFTAMHKTQLLHISQIHLSARNLVTCQF